jgi:hypothetical protein
MQVYLAASWSRRIEIVAVAAKIHEFFTSDITVNSRWLREDPADSLSTRALQDLQDIKAADLLIRFTDNPVLQFIDGVAYAPANLISGARMVEMGFALALGKIILVVGGVQPIFDNLSVIHHVKDVAGMMEFLAHL